MTVITDRESSQTEGRATGRRRAPVYHGPNRGRDEMPLPSIQRRLRRSLRTRGIWSTLVSAASAAASFVVRTHTERVLAKDLSGDAGVVRSTNINIVLVSGDGPLPATMPDAWASDRALMAMFRSYLANGFGGVIAEVDGVAVGYLWWTRRTGESRPNHPHLARFGVELANDDLWIFDLNMLKKHRRYSSEFLTRAEGLARDHGFRRILFCVAADNRPALWLYHRWGWKAVDSVESIQVLRSVLISRRGVFLRNVPWSRRQAFDYRTIWRPRAAHGLAAERGARKHDELSLPSLASEASRHTDTIHVPVVDSAPGHTEASTAP